MVGSRSRLVSGGQQRTFWRTYMIPPRGAFLGRWSSKSFASGDDIQQLVLLWEYCILDLDRSRHAMGSLRARVLAPEATLKLNDMFE